MLPPIRPLCPFPFICVRFCYFLNPKKPHSHKKSMADQHIYFKNGTDVEISSDDDGFRGAWYAATIIGPARGKNKFVIEYKTLMSDKNDSKPLRETLDLVQLRPSPPRERSRSFAFSEEVDAYHNEGWWEGVITEVLPDERYSVFFRGTREQLDFGQSDLRLHREWANGKWNPPFEGETESSATGANPSKETAKEEHVSKDPSKKVHFSKGTLVEVSSDEDGFQGAWFAATVIEQLSDGKFIIEYQSLRNEDDTAPLQEEVDSQHIRPYPPDTLVVDRFNQLEEVDALYNDGWWVGMVSKVRSQKYMVYFRGTNEEMEFKHSDLRLHQEWIDGKWVLASQGLKL